MGIDFSLEHDAKVLSELHDKGYDVSLLAMRVARLQAIKTIRQKLLAKGYSFDSDQAVWDFVMEHRRALLEHFDARD